jgi:hypothetical protein
MSFAADPRPGRAPAAAAGARPEVSGAASQGIFAPIADQRRLPRVYRQMRLRTVGVQRRRESVPRHRGPEKGCHRGISADASRCPASPASMTRVMPTVATQSPPRATANQRGGQQPAEVLAYHEAPIGFRWTPRPRKLGERETGSRSQAQAELGHQRPHGVREDLAKQDRCRLAAGAPPQQSLTAVPAPPTGQCASQVAWIRATTRYAKQ